MTIRIDELDSTVVPNRAHEIPAMRDGLTVKLTVAQILALIEKGDLPADVLASLDLADSALQTLQPREDVASATTTDIGAAASQYVRITGTTGPITSLGTAADGVERDALFGGALTLTHNATSLILPSGANIITAAGDTALFRSEGSGNWRCVRYERADGKALAGGIALGTLTSASGTAVDFTGLPAGIKRLKVHLSGVSTNGSAGLLVQIGTSGGFQTTGYASGVAESFSSSSIGGNSTAGFLLTTPISAASVLNGSLSIDIINAANGTFVASLSIGRSDLDVAYTGGGAKALGDTLDRVRITTTNGTDAFDAGNINISYEV
jgi:hypothetical protein